MNGETPPEALLEKNCEIDDASAFSPAPKWATPAPPMGVFAPFC